MGGTSGFIAKLKVIWLIIMGVAVLSALVFALGIGSYYLFAITVVDIPPQQAQVPFKDVFKDVLQTVLVIATIVISAFGFGIYRLLSRQIEGKVAETNEKNLNIAFARLKVDASLTYWNLYRLAQGRRNPVKRSFLEMAIAETKDAYKTVIEKLDDREVRVERILINVNNNWAFFIYEQDCRFGPVPAADKVIALERLRYIEERKAKYSEMTVDVLDTIEKVAGRFRPATP